MSPSRKMMKISLLNKINHGEEQEKLSIIVFNTSDAERARILSGGNFGIGTNNPTSKLTVETAGAVDGIALNGSNNFVFAILESGTTSPGQSCNWRWAEGGRTKGSCVPSRRCSGESPWPLRSRRSA